METGAWRGCKAHVAVLSVLGLEGKTPQEALLTEAGGKDGWNLQIQH